jgi:UDP-N-acetylmuramoyl-L-alanyl-D-glutamate--2,6-diaminopimelate ligase
VPVAVVPHSAIALSAIAARFHGDAAARLVLCGITGTNGKSTTAMLTQSIMNASGRKTGLIGTLGWGVTELSEATHTTPDAVSLHRLFAGMESAGCFGVVMEVSSHAVRQHRTCGLNFEVGVITNVTHDHLDYHKSWEDYRDAKAEFCRSLAGSHRRKPDGALVYWREDDAARAIGEAFPGRSVSAGVDGDADVYAHSVRADLDGTVMSLRLHTGEEVEVSMSLLGAYVPANATLAAAAAAELGASASDIRRGLEVIDRVPGRFESMGGGDRPVVVIDYAHTADAFEQILQACRSLGAKRVITVFGCGGDRDREKRPRMGEVASRLSDFCYVTTDNPRNEDIGRIVDDILAGITDRRRVTVELDRAGAIQQAVAEADAGDVVAVLGKGHENYQIMGTEKVPFSDRTTSEGALEQWSVR